MKFRLAAILLLLLASSASAVEPKAVVATIDLFAAPEVVTIDASESTGDQFYWEPLTGKPIAVDTGGKKAYFAPTPGKHEWLFITIGVADGKAKAERKRITVQIPFPPPPIPDPTPDPRPDPKPDPKPVPVVTGHLFATYIADAAKIQPSHAALKTSPAIRSLVPTVDASFRWYQSDESEPVQKGLMGYVTGKDGVGLPCLLIQSPDGKVVSTLKAPTEDDIVAELKRIRGTK